MSGLAKVARILGAEVTGSDRSLHGHAAENVPPGAEVVVLQRDRAGQPGAHHRRARAAPRRPARRAHAAQADDRRLRHARQDDDDLDDRPRAAAARATWSAARSARTGTNADWTDGEWLIVEADESDRSLLKLHPTIAVVTNAELDHHTDLRLVSATWTTRSASSSRSRSDAVVPPDLPGCARTRTCFGEYEGPLPRAGRAQPAQRRGRAQGDRARRGRRAGSGGPPRRRSPGAGRRFEIVGTARRARRSSTTTPITRPRSAPRSTPPARRAPTGSSRSSSRTCSPHAARGEGVRRTPSRRPTWSCCSTSIPRASARGLPRRHRPAGRRGAPPTPPRHARDLGAARTQRPANFCKRTLQEGDLLLTMGAGDVNTIGRDLVAHSEPTRTMTRLKVGARARRRNRC